jgi:succinate dehydrogenase flavin-adding protein (antitoxin of CptAB toxin-antitoxin module)
MDVKNKKVSEKSMEQSLVESLHLAGFTEDQQEKILSLFLSALSSRVTMDVWKKLSDEQKGQIQELLGDSSDEKLLHYINEHVANFSELVHLTTEKTIEDFKKKRSALAK